MDLGHELGAKPAWLCLGPVSLHRLSLNQLDSIGPLEPRVTLGKAWEVHVLWT